MTPGHELVKHLLALHQGNKISAKDCTTAMWFAFKAGVSEAKEFKLSPDSQFGHCSRKLKSALGYSAKNSDLYEFELPGHCKYDLSRSLHTSYAIPFHEALARDLHRDVDCHRDLRALWDSRAFPPAYWEHPIVVAHPDRPTLPLAIYMDAVPHSLHDSVLGWWAVNLINDKRYFWGVCRKSEACKCGCRGWCIYYQFLRWPSGR